MRYLEGLKQLRLWPGILQSSVSQMIGCCRYTYTAEDVQKIILEKQAKGLSRRNVAAERARLTTLRDQAEENKDFTALEQ